jgi:hypothetical protein
MFAVNQDKANKSPGQILKGLRGAFLERLIDDPFGLRKLFRWLQDEARRNAMWRELNVLNDHCLNDMGLRRPFNLRTDDLVKQRLRAGRPPL